jgi:hypothetical protein
MSSPDYKSATKNFFKKNLVDKVVSANKKIKRGALDSWKCYIKEALEFSNKLSIFDNLCEIDDTEELINPAYIDVTIEPEGDPSQTEVICTTIPINPPDIAFIFNTIRNIKLSSGYDFVAEAVESEDSLLYWKFISGEDQENPLVIQNGSFALPNNVLNGTEQPVKLKSIINDFTKITEIKLDDVHGVGEIDTDLLTNLRKIYLRNTEVTREQAEANPLAGTQRNRFTKLIVYDWVNNDDVLIEWSGNALDNSLINEFLTNLVVVAEGSTNTGRIVGLFDQFSDVGEIIGEGNDTTIERVQNLEINNNMKIEIRKFSLRCEFNRNDNAY